MQFLSTLLLAWSCSLASLTAATSYAGTILVLARDAASSYSATSGLNAYGIPYELVLVPQAGITLPALTGPSSSSGLYGGFIILSEVSYDYSGSWHSALTEAQWQTLYGYQTRFGARMVRLDVYPSSDFGVTTTIPSMGCCETGVEQLLSFTDTSAFPTAGLRAGATVTTVAMWHYPATITGSNTSEVASFAPDAWRLTPRPGGAFTTPSTAAVINRFSGRQQMVWFTSWATDWSATSNLIMHAHIHWITRGLFVGRRRVYFNTQVDDMQLATFLYQPANGRFRARPVDLDRLVSWQSNLNARLPSGSSYQVEIGHNGNGNVEWAINNDTAGICQPDSMIQYDAPADPPLEFQKPLGTGADLWPTTPTSYQWRLDCVTLDALSNWFRVAAHRDAFAHVSHTFSHENLNNSTYPDTSKEISFNVAWLQQTGISAGAFSSNSLIPPAITGLHNGDAIRAWMDHGIKYVVGDSSRAALLNPVNEHWPLISTVAENGYAGLTIIPRWSNPIYYNCDLANCTLHEWVATSGGSGDFANLLAFSRATYSRHLLRLRHDGFMFHQANLRSGDTPPFTVGDQTGNMSLMQIFVEVVVQEMMRLTTWPLVSIKQNDLAVQFENRMAQDACKPLLTYHLSADETSISSVTVTAGSTNTCPVPIPVTFPVGVATPAGSTSEQLGSDPLTVWVKMSGSAVEISTRGVTI
ncbi:hypothetical protein BJ875DRAFT_504369 [Amylocarpus encephaloides]|uniref:Extracellular serine-rich protein n=1 Tax=Amylocarpus encephaloides TaxID=45428 RepID=A0A9P7YKV4_9HELO|nr:hypothetical protein BJ875DRAFT_504369 [Amylocarpus encephaloides]